MLTSDSHLKSTIIEQAFTTLIVEEPNCPVTTEKLKLLLMQITIHDTSARHNFWIISAACKAMENGNTATLEMLLKEGLKPDGAIDVCTKSHSLPNLSPHAPKVLEILKKYEK